MKTFVIPPVSQLQLIDYGDHYFCLTQLYIKHAHYREFFKQKVADGKFVLLDNGIGDGTPITQDVLYEVTKDLMPSEVIPLDTLFDSRRTLENVFDFINRLRDDNLLDKIDIFAVAQGNTFDEWIYCYKALLSIEEVKTIGMSKLSIPWVVSRSTKDTNIGRDRNVMYDFLKNSGLIQKSLHMLGSGGVDEYEHYKGDPFVRSSDSCVAVWSAMNGISFDESYKRIPTPKNYFDLEINEQAVALAIENIRIFKDILSEV